MLIQCVVASVDIVYNSIQSKSVYSPLVCGNSKSADKGNSVGNSGENNDSTMSQRGVEISSGELVSRELGPSRYIPDVEEVTTFGRYWELEESSQQILDVQGKLHAKVKFWKEVLQAPSPIIECIIEGYKLPLLSLPLQFVSPNQKSALENADFVGKILRRIAK